MPDTNCPDRQQLIGFLRGALPDPDAGRVSAHVATCQVCQATLHTLDKAANQSRPDERGTLVPSVTENSPQDTVVLGQLGEYKLLAKLGQGGMGVVYKAVHTELDRVVAVKVMALGRIEDEPSVERFKREIKAVGQLDHPHIVRAHDARQIEGVRFLVMEFVSGLDLTELVRRQGPLSPADACELIRQAAVGLECAHQHGLIHRDIKPSNLMLTDNGVVKILDLGLARFGSAHPAEVRVTAAGQALGTPDYMAPEQVEDSRGVDIRGDLYSLACTLYFLLTGQAPFEGSKYPTIFDRMMAHMHEPVPPVTEHRKDVPAGLVAVLDRLLAKSPDDRYSTPGEVADALAKFASGSDTSALIARATGRPVTPSSALAAIAARTARRRRLATQVMGVSVLLVLLASLIGLGMRAFQGDENGNLPQAKITGDVRVVPKVLEPPEQRELPGWIVMSWSLEGTGKPDLWLFRPDGTERIQITDDPRSFDVHPNFSPDGRRIAFIRGVQFDQPYGLWVCRADGTQARELLAATSTRERFLSPVWASDSRIYYARDPRMDRRPDMELWQLDLETGDTQRVFSFRDTPAGNNGIVTDVSPDGKYLAVIAQDSGIWASTDVYITDRDGELIEPLWEDDPDDRHDGRAIWSADGRRVAWHHNFTRGVLAEEFYYGLGLAEQTGGKWVCQLQPQRELLLTPLAWSPSSDHVLCARMSTDQQATLILLDQHFQTTRELFDLTVLAWQLGQRDFARLADWAVVPDDVPLPRP